jgi:hypothetical protein
MAAPRVGEQLEVQDPLEEPEQDSGQVALNELLICLNLCADGSAEGSGAGHQPHDVDPHER